MAPAQVNLVSEALETVLPPAFAGVVASGVVFVLVFLAFYLGNRLVVNPVVDRVFEARGLDDHARRPLNKITTVAVLFVGLSIAFGMAGFGNLLQSLATIAAAATLAIGFAVQAVIRNFVSGVLIYADEPFRIGDWIEWNDNSGIVEDISFRVTRVRTFDNELLTVPNSELTDNVVKNPVAKENLRVKFTFGIDYGDDVERATEIILEEARSHPEIIDDPGPSVRLTELADSYVGLQSRIWIANPSRADFVKTRGEYAEAVKRRFDDEGITIPFPQRTVSGREAWAEPGAFAGERAG